MKFEFLDHPADIGFRAYGRSLEELFANCALAVVSIIMDPSKIVSRERISLVVEGSGYETLLVNWLNEVLYYIDSKRMTFKEFEIPSLTESRIDAIAVGEARDAGRHPPKVVVKAVTYHQLSLRQTDGRWVAEVYVDV